MNFNTAPKLDPDTLIQTADQAASDIAKIRQQIGQVIYGQEQAVENTLVALLAGGHALLVGVPGLAKTRLVETLGTVLGLDEKRIQFTPDLMPSDIIGSEVMDQDSDGRRSFRYIKGPVFAQLLMADEINRASPRTQSALLQAMQEYHVSVAGQRHDLPSPFHVLATQNPLEQEGTYPLPEAQLDRFFFKLIVKYSNREELKKILDLTTAGSDLRPQAVLDEAKIIEHQHLVRRVVVAPHVQDFIVRCVLATHPQGQFAVGMVNQFLRVGASPRAAQAITLGAKVRALLDGRFHVSFNDAKQVAIPAMRHRVILNFEGEAEGITTDMVLEKLLAETPTTIESELTAGKV